VRLFDLKRPIKHATQRKLLDAASLLDIWNLRHAALLEHAASRSG
jgi:hypothetical protein